MRASPLLLTLLGWMSSQALAQTPPSIPPPPTYDAGALMRQTEQLMRPNPAHGVRREAMPPAMTIAENTVIEVKRIQFAGNQHLRTDQLQTLAAPFENRRLGATDLMHLTHAVTEAYRQTGWVVNVYVPRQRLSGGDLTLQVIETVPPTRAP
jgi:hemolysin activation/secretion protein